MNRRVSEGQGRSLRLLLGGAVAFVVALLLTAGAKGYRDLQSLQRREAVLEERVERTRVGIEDLRVRLELLKEDPATLERLAREELGMVRPEDIVFVLDSDAEKSPSLSVPSPEP